MIEITSLNEAEHQHNPNIKILINLEPKTNLRQAIPQISANKNHQPLYN